MLLSPLPVWLSSAHSLLVCVSEERAVYTTATSWQVNQLEFVLQIFPTIHTHFMYAYATRTRVSDVCLCVDSSAALLLVSGARVSFAAD